MFEIIKSMISAGGYKLADVQHKIKKLFILGDLNEDQMDELLILAAGGVSTDAERPETLQLINTLFEEINALKQRVSALEGEDPDVPVDPEEPVEPVEPVYPEWKAWDGLSKDYQNGAIVSHNGELWYSVFAGQNVWEPGTAGTETLWVKYVPEAYEPVETEPVETEPVE